MGRGRGMGPETRNVPEGEQWAGEEGRRRDEEQAGDEELALDEELAGNEERA
jgi:hypothetical protein